MKQQPHGEEKRKEPGQGIKPGIDPKPEENQEMEVTDQASDDQKNNPKKENDDPQAA